MRFNKKKILGSLLLVAALSACKKWDNHTEVAYQDLTKDLSEAIAANSSLSKFNEYLQKTGLDSLLRSSKSYTVWAPNNDALRDLDPAIVNDTARLKNFLKNHISNQSYFSRNAQDTIRVPMLNGKYNNFFGNKFDDAHITEADRFVKNGVLHTIDKSILVLPTIWDFVNTSTAQYVQNAFVAATTYEAFDPSLATIDSISATTGLPIYRPGTGIVLRNRFNEQVYDLKDESKQYTYFVIADAGFTHESDSLKVYYNSSSAASIDSLAKWYTVRDVALEGVYPATSFTGLVSKFGTPVPADASLIIETKKMSNGIVHIVSKLNVLSAAKLKPVTIQGENPSGFLVNRTGNTSYRVRNNPVTGLDFKDILVSGHNVTSYYSYYRLKEMPSVKYKVYAFAVNDFQGGAFTQNVVAKYFVPPSTYNTAATLAYAVPLSSAVGAYSEKLLGEFTFSMYGTMEIQLTSTSTNPITLDYLRLVPVP